MLAPKYPDSTDEDGDENGCEDWGEDRGPVIVPKRQGIVAIAANNISLRPTTGVECLVIMPILQNKLLSPALHRPVQSILMDIFSHIPRQQWQL